jgi:hypothetical protein
MSFGEESELLIGCLYVPNIFWSPLKVVMAIKCRRELLNGLYTGIDSRHITLTSKMVQLSFLVLFVFPFGLLYIFEMTDFLAQML